MDASSFNTHKLGQHSIDLWIQIFITWSDIYDLEAFRCQKIS